MMKNVLISSNNHQLGLPENISYNQWDRYVYKIFVANFFTNTNMIYKSPPACILVILINIPENYKRNFFPIH